MTPAPADRRKTGPEAPSGPYSQEPQLLQLRRRLSRALEYAGMEPADLAREIGKPRQLVWQWLSGVRIPAAVSIIRLARVLDVPADWLLGAPAAECGKRVLSLSRKMEGREDAGR